MSGARRRAGPGPQRDRSTAQAVLAAALAPLVYLAIAVGASALTVDHGTYERALSVGFYGLILQGAPAVLGVRAWLGGGEPKWVGVVVAVGSLALVPVLGLAFGLIHIGMNGGV